MRLVIVIMLLLVGSTAHAQDADCTDLSAVTWMEGTWVAEDEVRRTTETWTRVSEKTMEGVGAVYRMDTGVLTGSETLRLVEMGGDVFYLPKTPGNALPIAFLLSSCSPDSATFENPDHDFPQRLVYRHPSLDALHVDVSDLNGNGFRLEFIRGTN